MAKGIKVLMVDDEAFNYEVLSSTLPERFSVDYVSSGEQCLETAISHAPDVILLDVLMPGLDGYDTCRLLKNNPQTSSIPVIMVSGLEAEREKGMAFEVGCDAYLVKPYAISDLIESIDNFVTHTQE